MQVNLKFIFNKKGRKKVVSKANKNQNKSLLLTASAGNDKDEIISPKKQSFTLHEISNQI